MRSALFFAIILFATVFCADAQVIIKQSGSVEPEASFIRSGTPKEKTLPSISNQTPQSTYVRPEAKKRFKNYVNGMFGPVALAKNTASAGISTWKNSPEEWGDRWPGFGRRFASSVGKGIIKGTVIYGLDETFKLDSSYYRSKNKSVGARLSNALISTVTARDKNGKRVFGFPRIAGTYTASIVAAETWYPARFDYKDGLKNGTISLGLGAAFNIVKEFIKKK